MGRVRMYDALNVTCLTCNHLCFKRIANHCSGQQARRLCFKSSSTAGVRQDVLHPAPRIPAPLCCVGSRPLQASIASVCNLGNWQQAAKTRTPEAATLASCLPRRAAKAHKALALCGRHPTRKGRDIVQTTVYNLQALLLNCPC
jgi:hypothetical protein